jgi:hypothetical protein
MEDPKSGRESSLQKPDEEPAKAKDACLLLSALPVLDLSGSGIQGALAITAF